MMRTYPGVPELQPNGARNILEAVAIYRGRFAGHALPDSLRPFIGLKGYHWRGLVTPDASNQTLAASATFEDQISIAPGSFVLGLAAFSSQAVGFRFVITDRGTKQSLSNDYFNFCAAGGRVTAGGRSGVLPVWLPAPWMISQVGMVSVQIVNLAAAANTVNLVLYCAEKG